MILKVNRLFYEPSCLNSGSRDFERASGKLLAFFTENLDQRAYQLKEKLVIFSPLHYQRKLAETAYETAFYFASCLAVNGI